MALNFNPKIMGQFEKQQRELFIMSSLKNFADLGVAAKVLQALSELGYETPTPIQEKSIPVLLQEEDLLAQAQTGTGKTAAFALPILTNLDLTQKKPQALILTPTRELAVQVAEAFRSYAKYLTDFRILPIYGGQEYTSQLKALKRGVHVVVGTPGRLMDHLRRGTLVLDETKTIILDEADEMLKMGFIEDVQWILDQTPKTHQTALFSATIPGPIQKIANQYLHNARDIRINPKVKTVQAIKQYCMMVSNNHKLEALTRFLEIEAFDAVLIFTRTKNESTELADKLEARGYAAAAVNGDMKQSLREKVIKQIKNKTLDIIVGTDVAARGLDIDRITHVVSYDIPYDTTSYVHRIGRTGRAGREGKALLLVEPRERYMLRDIERAIDKQITVIDPPSISQINEKRMAGFQLKILQVLEKQDLDSCRELIENIAQKTEYAELDIAAALAFLVQKEKHGQILKEDDAFLRSVKEEQKKSHNDGEGKKRKRSRFERFKHGRDRSQHRSHKHYDNANPQKHDDRKSDGKKHDRKNNDDKKFGAKSHDGKPFGDKRFGGKKRKRHY